MVFGAGGRSIGEVLSVGTGEPKFNSQYLFKEATVMDNDGDRKIPGVHCDQ